MKETSNLPEIPLKSGKSEAGAALYRFAGYELDCDRWQLRFGSDPVTLHRRSFDLLLCLVRAHPRVVSRDDLMDAVWPGQFVDENNLAQQVSTLRKAMTRHPEATRLVETVPGRGYRLACDVEAVDSASPGLVLSSEQSITRITVEEETEEIDDSSAPAAEALPGETGALTPASFPVNVPPPRRRGALWTAAAIAFAAVLALAGWIGWRWWQHRTSGPPIQVVLTPMEGSTGDITLDHALSAALRFDLAQSPFVTLLPQSQVADTLRRMRRPDGEALSSATAREVCERSSSQAVIHAVLAHTGQQFLLTAEAVSCVNGGTLASTSQEAGRAEDLPLALGRLTDHLRRQLGEARWSVARFTTPAYTYETVSLEALKANYEAMILGNSGKVAEALEASRRAVTIDPDFAMAYFNLCIAQSNLDDPESARASITRAYELRKNVDPQSQRIITARYEGTATGDLYAALRNGRLWVEEFPRNAYPWDALSETLAKLGDYAGAVAAEQKAAALRPDAGMIWASLAQAQIHTGDLAGARLSAERGLAGSPELEPVRMTLARVALHAHDDALAREQLAWMATHPGRFGMPTLEAELARLGGRFREAQRLTALAAVAYQEQGSEGGAAYARKVNAMELIASGDRADGERLFRAERLDPEQPADLMSLALLGDVSQSRRLLDAELHKRERDTQWHLLYAPMIVAMGELATGQPQKALDALNAEGVLDHVDAQIAYLRGSAYLALHDPANAAVHFGKAVEHPGFDSSYAYPLSWLGLARADAALGKNAEARRAYVACLDLRHNADENDPVSAAARQELQNLS
ncbi:winged helix-turn-helix domain-containing protein [Terriglobus aquaticus]|uniref:Winged helix-turn-helix domain-containing protein n=1 Tax=Terriglobus aquaticus TaxID=940139 RepID=A0ABW9KM25_9BACT|nr:winged helix-turn-helix domain-containing protein [Terriglobus aquaticus]